MELNVIAVKKLLAEKKMNISDLATLIRMSPSNLSCVLRRGTCALKTGGLIADALNVEIEEIWKGD